jgi:hypothetical protein
MPFPLVVPNAALVTLHWQIAGERCHNVLGAVKPGGVTVTQAMADQLGAAIKPALGNSGMAPLLSSSTALVDVGVRDISTAGMPEFLDSGAATLGTAVDEPLPTQIALVVSSQTDRAGASYRGRTYFSGWTEISNLATATASSAATTAAMAFLQACSDAMDNAGLAFAVISRPREARTIPAVEISAKAGWATPITSLEIRNAMWDTQRRRATVGGGGTLLAKRNRVKLRRGS